ncbi:unnamed protein product, partial [Rodentolepis nana]|uniref:Zf-RVT domain-containing protein n=1 Tax=Rodentolepis nana TaxID=102285 RepID=A0A0R3TGT3_RODNA
MEKTHLIRCNLQEEMEKTHLIRLGVYTQPTWTFTDWEYTLNPHAPFTDWEYTLNPYALRNLGVYTQLTCPLCNLQEEMEKTHLIRCQALKTTTET